MSTTLKRLWLASAIMLGLAMNLAPMAPVMADETTDAEATQHIDFWGQLQELSSTDLPTTIVVRKDPTGSFTDYTVDVPVGAIVNPEMDWWITGDYVHVVGTQNENTGVVEADIVVDSSINVWNNRGLNGWITAIDTSASTMTVQWQGIEHTVHVTDDTHMVVPPINPASLTDFQIGDRVRLRLDARTDEDDARIIVALRRGDHIYLMARTRGFAAELTDIDDNGDGTGTLTLTLLANAHLRAGDVNNLIGVEGDEVTVTYDSTTKFVRRYNGLTTVGEFVEGDVLFVVGRYNDDDTISARLVKDTNIWRLGVARHTGIITSIDTSTNTIVVNPVEGEGQADITSLTITYSDTTVFHKDDAEITESDLAVGDEIHVRGTARLDNGVISIGNVTDIAVVTDDAGTEGEDAGA